MTRNAKEPGTPTDWYTADFYNAKLRGPFRRDVIVPLYRWYRRYAW